MRGDDPEVSVFAPNKDGAFHFGRHMGDKILPQRKRGWTIKVQPLENMVLPTRFERVAYRLGGDSKGFHHTSRERIKSLTIQ